MQTSNPSENKKLNLQNLAQKLEAHGLNQAYVAEKLEVSREAVSQWFKNQKFPRPAKLLKLSKLLGLSFDELVTRTPFPNDPVIAYRKKANHKIDSSYTEKSKHMGRLLEELIPYLPFDKYSRPASLIKPENNYEYIQKVSQDVRKQINPQNNDKLLFSDFVSLFSNLRAVIIPVFWGACSKHENALHIYLPNSMTTWVYLNLDSKIHDFKFWMAHELGHIKAPDLVDKEIGEDFADSFAGALLVNQEIAKNIVDAFKTMTDPGKQINFIKDCAERLLVSPITVYYEARKYAMSVQTEFVNLEINQAIFKATSNFGKDKPTVAEQLFNSSTPSAAEYISATEKNFDSTLFNALKSYLRANQKSSSYVQAILNNSLVDAQYLYEELC
jgi:transcriptional regulator with XRE-family HTH domain